MESSTKNIMRIFLYLPKSIQQTNSMKKNNFNPTFLALLGFILMTSCASNSSSNKSSNSFMNNMVAKMQVKDPIDGVCDQENVIAILSFEGNGQVKAVAPKSKSEISQELNTKVSFLQDKPNYDDKGMVGLIVNCKGEMVRCQIDNKTQNPELDAQIVAVFAELKNWKAGTWNKQPVDTSVLYSFEIKKGKIILN
jgi:hypothetical protein